MSSEISKLITLQQQHSMQKKLKSVKPQIDNAQPKNYSHITSSYTGKTYFNKKQRYDQIMNENNHLVNRINSLSVNKRPNSPSSNYKSLNLPARKSQINKINQENKQILKQLVQVKSTYSNEFQNFKKAISKYRKIVTRTPARFSPMPVPTKALRKNYPEIDSYFMSPSISSRKIKRFKSFDLKKSGKKKQRRKAPPKSNFF